MYSGWAIKNLINTKLWLRLAQVLKKPPPTAEQLGSDAAARHHPRNDRVIRAVLTHRPSALEGEAERNFLPIFLQLDLYQALLDGVHPVPGFTLTGNNFTVVILLA